VDVLSEHLLGPVPGFILVIFGGYDPVHGLIFFCRDRFLILLPLYLVNMLTKLL
jgi:hypothetical protein